MTEQTNLSGEVQRVLVFQQNGSGERKIEGIRSYGAGSIKLEVVSIAGDLPEVIDDGREFLPESLEADLVLDFLRHQDLSHDLVAMCHEKHIPVISSGKKIPSKWVHTPPT